VTRRADTHPEMPLVGDNGALRDQGLAVVIISHNLDNVFHVADRISVLRLGRHVATFDRRTAAREDVVAAITGGVFAPAEPPVEALGV
jgi:ABC-type sugar transport system ATPase subunit